MISPKPLKPPLRIDSWKHPSTLTFKREQRAYRPERKPVTIATGFIYDGGMLFCADTKITGVCRKRIRFPTLYASCHVASMAVCFGPYGGIEGRENARKLLLEPLARN